MPLALRVRPARLTDAPAILDEMTAFNAHEDIVWTRRRGGPALRRLLRTPALGAVLVALDGARLTGYAIVTWGYDLEWNGRDAMLTELWVAHAARGHGVGKALLAATEIRARRAGAGALHLQVRHGNRSARALYDQVGFKAPGRLLLTKPLAKPPR